MIDTHAHLTDPRFCDDVDSVVERAWDSGVVAIINPATNMEDLGRVVEVVNKYPKVYGLVGIYPGEANPSSWESDLAKIWDILEHDDKIVGVGEIGLDEAPLKENPDLEYAVFEVQLAHAATHDYPVVIHTRNTEKEMWEVMKRQSKLPRAHMHCFSGSIEWLEYVLSSGFYVGFDGNVTYKNAENLRTLAKNVPLDRLLLETDAPYLPPTGHRGERNEPGNVRITTEFLAEIRGENFDTLIDATTNNAKTLYGI